MRIKRLSPLLANQIAAGEVIERPASVVKELLENSLDAKAISITIDIEKGGKQLIQVRDDGVGIHKEDLNLAVSPHATSKISTIEDLTAIASLGFRGEALASIGSVSGLKIISCRSGEEHAATIEVKGSIEKPIEQVAAHPIGTTVKVQQLFYNTPARRKFLKSDATEFSHIEDVVKRMALSHFACGFQLRHQEKVIFNLAKSTNFDEKARRVTKLFGQAFMKHACFVDTEASGLRLWGWIALPSFMKSQTDLQYFYINGRTVKDKLISHAIRKAYQELLFEGRHPAYILHLEIDPREIDVNVHPTKHEVRFEQARLVHDFIFSRLFQVINQTIVAEKLGEDYLELNVGKEREVKIPEIIKTDVAISESFGKPIGLFQNNYLLSEHGKGLLVIDLVAARRAIFLKQYNAEMNNQPLLFPQRIPIEETLLNVLQDHFKELNLIGLKFDRINTDCIIIRELPSFYQEADLNHLFHTLASLWHKNPKLSLTTEIIASAAITEKTSLEWQAILKQLTTLGLTDNKSLSTFCKLIPHFPSPL